MPARISRAYFGRLGIPLVLLVAVTACAQPQQTAAQPESPAAASANPSECVRNYDKATDYFPNKVTFEHATGVSVTYTNATKLVEIDRPWKDADTAFRVLLVQCGTPVPDDITADATIEVPLRRVATFSTTQLPSFALLDQVDTIVAHGGLQYVSTPAVVKAAEQGAIVEVGDQTHPDLERLLAAEPDAALLSAGTDGDAHRAAVDAVGIPAVPYADWLEETLLGRAEWLKVVALLTNTEQRANESFHGIARAADGVITRAESQTRNPKVIVGTPYEGTWFMPAGESYIASALTDLGAEYPWAETKGTGALSLDIEAVLSHAADADIWIGAGSVRGTLDDLVEQDDRFDEFRALRKGQVYAEDRNVNASGGNALFELGAVRPDLLLGDLFKILYPNKAGEIDFRFYDRVGALNGG